MASKVHPIAVVALGLAVTVAVCGDDEDAPAPEAVQQPATKALVAQMERDIDKRRVDTVAQIVGTYMRYERAGDRGRLCPAFGPLIKAGWLTEELLMDRWGQRLRTICSSDGGAMRIQYASAGADGEFETADDVVSDPA